MSTSQHQDGDSPTPLPGETQGRRRLSLGPRMRTVLAVAVGLLTFAVVADVVTASPELCSSCHEMDQRVAEWSESAHAGVACVDCHVEPYEWYARPQALAARARLLGRDAVKHATGDYQDPVGAHDSSSTPVPDEACLQCHDPNREATSGFRILIDHAEHAERNGSCVSCHVDTAHPEPERGRPLSLMAQCFTCHGTVENPQASAECGVCHPGGYELRPASHEDVKWKRAHGRVASADAEQCELCHDKPFCTGCHGLEMPHPEGWERGRTGHAVVAQDNRAICATCHDEKPDLCSMCHHKAYDPAKGDWVKQHFLEVRNRGAAFCFGCHAPVFCVECHAS